MCEEDDIRDGLPKKSSCSFGFCSSTPNPPPPSPHPYLDNLYPFFWTPLCQKFGQGTSPPSPSPNWPNIYSLWKVDKKFGQGSPPPLIWTKSKRTATFFRETFPYWENNTNSSFLLETFVENFIERHYRLKYRFNYIHHYHNINLTFCSINSTFFLPFREEYIPPRASSCTWSDKIIWICAGLDPLVDVACFWWIYKWLLFFVFFVRHKSECPNEQIVDIRIQVLLVSIVHQSKGPLGSHERPDPSDHVAELEVLSKEKEHLF